MWGPFRAGKGGLFCNIDAILIEDGGRRAETFEPDRDPGGGARAKWRASAGFKVTEKKWAQGGEIRHAGRGVFGEEKFGLTGRWGVA